jgi:hypothetical protein
MRPRDVRRYHFSDLRFIFPDWLLQLRAAGYRIDAVSAADQPAVVEGLRARGVTLEAGTPSAAYGGA